MDVIERYAGLLALAFLRYLPPVVLPALSPLRWAPALVRIVLAIGLAWLTVLAMPVGAAPAAGWIVAAIAELSIGFVFGLAVMMPQAALHASGWLLDIQAGLGAASLFNPGSQAEAQSLLGGALTMLATVLFFAMDLHLDLYRALIASGRALPVGSGSAGLDVAAFMAMLASSFLLGLMVVAPMVLGLFAVDVGVAYASRSMPQANVYFLTLPLKVIVALGLMVATLPFMPALIERLFRDAFARIPALLGG